MTLKKMAEKTQAADTGLTIHVLDLLCLWYCTCEMFLSVIVYMSHDQRDRLELYWFTLQQFFVAFYENTM
jgi:hypothetical protein